MPENACKQLDTEVNWSTIIVDQESMDEAISYIRYQIEEALIKKKKFEIHFEIS